MKVFYTVQSREHVMQLNCQPQTAPDVGDAMNTINLLGRNGIAYLATTVIGQLMTVTEPLYNAAQATFLRAELWRFEPGTFDATYISTEDISDPGLSASATVTAAEQVFTFRSQEGGVMRVHLLESTEQPSSSQGYAAMSALNQAFVTHFTRPENVWMARDTSYPIAFLRHHPGINEAVFKKVYRQ